MHSKRPSAPIRDRIVQRALFNARISGVAAQGRDRGPNNAGLADKKCVWGDYSVEYGYAALRWNSDHVSPLPHSTGSMLGTGFPE